MAVYKSAYDDFPQFEGAVVRAWSHDYGGLNGVAEFATVWDEERRGFYDCCVNSGGHLDGVAFDDASDAVLSRWRALLDEPASPRPPDRQPARGELLDGRYG